jgi:hypothetical protein
MKRLSMLRTAEALLPNTRHKALGATGQITFNLFHLFLHDASLLAGVLACQENKWP